MILPFLLNIEHCWPFISPHSKMKGFKQQKRECEMIFLNPFQMIYMIIITLLPRLFSFC